VRRTPPKEDVTTGFDYVDWLEDNLADARRSAGTEWTATCPSCGKYGGFYVNTDPDKGGRYVCFKCDFRGYSFVGLLSQVEGISHHEAQAKLLRSAVDFKRREKTVGDLLEAVKASRRRADEEVDWEAEWAAVESVDYPLPSNMIPVWDGKEWRVPEYLTERGFKRSILAKWGVGYCERGEWGDRIIIPIDCPNGKSFTGRTMDKRVMPKYKNPTGADHGRLLYGWSHLPFGSEIVIVEGPLDALKFQQHDIPAVGCGGKALRVEQMAMLFTRSPDTPVTIALDPDATRHDVDAYNMATQLMVHFKQIYVAMLPDRNRDGEKADPGNSKRKQAHIWLEEAKPYRGARAPRTSILVGKALKKSLSRW
jgi:DNA primase